MKRCGLFLIFISGFLIVFVFVTNIVIYAGTKAHIYAIPEEAPEVEVALIPGAAVFENGALSAIFLDRVDTAIELYEAGKVSKILVSGDNSTDSYNEVNPVRLYLLSKGIPEQDIFLDHAGFDTYSSAYRARDIFGVSSLIITTQTFHLPRAVFIARRLGIEAYGVKTNIEDVLFRNHVREVFAKEKAILDLIINREPKYLGEEIPITED